MCYHVVVIVIVVAVCQLHLEANQISLSHECHLKWVLEKDMFQRLRTRGKEWLDELVLAGMQRGAYCRPGTHFRQSIHQVGSCLDKERFNQLQNAGQSCASVIRVPRGSSSSSSAIGGGLMPRTSFTGGKLRKALTDFGEWRCWTPMALYSSTHQSWTGFYPNPEVFIARIRIFEQNGWIVIWLGRLRQRINTA